jgi:hypothetical protein
MRVLFNTIADFAIGGTPLLWNSEILPTLNISSQNSIIDPLSLRLLLCQKSTCHEKDLTNTCNYLDGVQFMF